MLKRQTLQHWIQHTDLNTERPKMNMDLDLNSADFQLCDGFGFYTLSFIRFGFDNLVWNFFATFSSVSELQITALRF